MTRIKLSAFQIDNSLSKFLKACDLINNVGTKVKLVFTTEKEVDSEYIKNLISHIEKSEHPFRYTDIELLSVCNISN